ncbi:MAG: histidine ammonia-lyase [Planctomycetes bacterium]|nr:histidine ammonia-lyase [Planctomycetota bacterium]MBI3834706.1 histidine ammonia-lyase [Planctomycetota bacterium]
MPTQSSPLNADGHRAERASFILDGSPLTLEILVPACHGQIHLDIAEAGWRRLEKSHQAVNRIAAGPEAAYGINTGFGHLCTKRISPDQVSMLQSNLVLSHAVGVGPPAPAEIVRLMLLLKIQALLQGVSGVSHAPIEWMRQALNADMLPVVPMQGSLGASGDLAPLAHLVLPMLGHGRVRLDGVELNAADASFGLEIKPVTLGPKEGLALVNGLQFMTANAVAIAVRARNLVKIADIVAAMSLEGLAGSIRPFDPRLQQLRPHQGAIEVAGNVRRLMRASEIVESHRHCNRVQDPYSLRCVPQVHGAVRDSLRHACEVVETEINAVTDNPIIFDDGDVVSGGLFHGEPLAIVLDYLAIALSELASISERRTFLLLSGAGGLPPLLTPNPGVNSGLMVPQYTAAALVSENKGLATPASVDSIPTSLGQEDHVSMGARAAVKCMTILENTETVLAIEQLCAAQALDFRVPLRAGLGPRAAYEQIRKSISHAPSDRIYGDDIRMSLQLLRKLDVLRCVEGIVGELL